MKKHYQPAGEKASPIGEENQAKAEKRKWRSG